MPNLPSRRGSKERRRSRDRSDLAASIAAERGTSNPDAGTGTGLDFHSEYMSQSESQKMNVQSTARFSAPEIHQEKLTSLLQSRDWRFGLQRMETNYSGVPRRYGSEFDAPSE